MARLGHDGVNAAMIYQHATREADRVIADALEARMKVAQKAASEARQDAQVGESEADAEPG